MLALVPVLALMLQAPADTARRPAAWAGALSYGVEWFRGSPAALGAWKTLDASVQRRMGRTAVVVEALRTERFDRVDAGGAAELYLPLAGRAYAAARVQAVPCADVLPRFDGSLELFQALPRALELSGAARVMAYPDRHIPIYSAGLARYAGDWYLRTRWSVIPSAGTTGWSGTATARRYFAPPLEFSEVSAGWGLEPVTVAARRVEIRQSRFLALRVQRYLGPTLGVAAGASLSRFEGIPDRVGATAGAMLRW